MLPTTLSTQLQPLLVSEDTLPLLLKNQDQELQLLSLNDPTIPQESSFSSKNQLYAAREEWLAHYHREQLQKCTRAGENVADLSVLTLNKKPMTRLPAEIASFSKLKT